MSDRDLEHLKFAGEAQGSMSRRAARPSSSPMVAAPRGSLWTTPVPVDTTPLAVAVRDPATTRERMREAVERANRRADELAGKLSNDVLWRTF